MQGSLFQESVKTLVQKRNATPQDILGPHHVTHQGQKAVAIRAYLPDSDKAWVIHQAHDLTSPMKQIHPDGLFEAICPVDVNNHKNRYQLRILKDGKTTTMHDPYSFDTIWTDYDFHLFAEGTHLRAYERMGAQMRTVDGVQGVNFSVWAPNAVSVAITGDFNCWDNRKHQMHKRIPSGVWELFIPDAMPGQKYKYHVTKANGQTVDKADPFGFAAELPPCTASIVSDLTEYKWKDDAWLTRREQTSGLDQPISVYEVHLGSWQRGSDGMHGWLSYQELAHRLVEYCQRMGYTHIELLPVSEHPYSGSWGYQTVGYFAPTSRYGSPEDFMYFVDYCHQNDIGVIIDWVPAHYPRDEHGLRDFDGTPLYEHADPRQGEHPDWGTMIFNYGRNEVRTFLLANAMFWLDKYHIDGLRVDAVASMLYLDYSREEGEWVPNVFGGRENLEAISLLKEFNEQTHGHYPGVLTIAEESTAWGGVSHPTYTGGLGFNLKWNMGWMNDTLRFMQRDPIYRSHHHGELTFSLIYAFTENFTLPLSHDEVVHGKGALLDQMPGDLWQKFANLRLLYSYMWTHPGKKLLFMGSDFGQWTEWNHDADLQWDLLQWDTHQGIQNLVADLNKLYREQPALHEVDFDGNGFEWIDCNAHEDCILSYIRKAKDPNDYVVVICNFTPIVRDNYRIGVPQAGTYREIFNSDSNYYDGTNVGNATEVRAVEHESHGRPCSFELRVPPLATLVLRPT